VIKKGRRDDKKAPFHFVLIIEIKMRNRRPLRPRNDFSLKAGLKCVLIPSSAFRSLGIRLAFYLNIKLLR